MSNAAQAAFGTSKLSRISTESASHAHSIPRYLDIDLIRRAQSAEPRFQVAVLRTPAEIAAIEQDWRLLERSIGSDEALFQGFDWISSWMDTYRNVNRACEPFVVTVRAGGRLLLIWPLERARVGPLSMLTWLSHPFGQYGDVLVARGPHEGDVLALAWNFISTGKHANVVRLRHVRRNAAIERLGSHLFIRSPEVDGAPFMDLTRFSGEADYDARYSKTQRRRRKRIRAGFESEGRLEFRQIDNLAEAKSAITEILKAKQAWLDERGLFSRPIFCPLLGSFLLDIFENATDLKLLLYELSVDSRPIAWEIALRYRGRHCSFITAHPPEITDLSPARLRTDFSQRMALADGVSIYDLMVPPDPYKSSWATGTTEVADYYAPLSASGRLYGALYVRFLRPVIRNAIGWIPVSARRLISHLCCRPPRQ